MTTRPPPGFGPAESGDDVLIGYDCAARTADGAVAETMAIREPLAGSDGERAIVQYVKWRRPRVEAGLRVDFRCVWLPRAEATAQGYLSGKDGAQ